MKDFSDVCDGSCPAYMIAQTELDVLMTLRWHLNVATPYFWLGCYMNILTDRIDIAQQETIWQFGPGFLDIIMHTSLCITISYSLLASTVLFICLQDEDLVHETTGYGREDMIPVTEIIVRNQKVFSDWLHFPAPHESCKGDDFEHVVKHNSAVLERLLERIKLGKL